MQWIFWHFFSFLTCSCHVGARPVPVTHKTSGFHPRNPQVTGLWIHLAKQGVGAEVVQVTDIGIREWVSNSETLRGILCYWLRAVWCLRSLLLALCILALNCRAQHAKDSEFFSSLWASCACSFTRVKDKCFYSSSYYSSSNQPARGASNEESFLQLSHTKNPLPNNRLLTITRL